MALVAYARIEGLVEVGMRGNVIARVWRSIRYPSNKAVRAEVDAASVRLLADAHRFADHPATKPAHQASAAFYLQATVPDRARPYLFSFIVSSRYARRVGGGGRACIESGGYSGHCPLVCCRC